MESFLNSHRPFWLLEIPQKKICLHMMDLDFQAVALVASIWEGIGIPVFLV